MSPLRPKAPPATPVAGERALASVLVGALITALALAFAPSARAGTPHLGPLTHLPNLPLAPGDAVVAQALTRTERGERLDLYLDLSCETLAGADEAWLEDLVRAALATAPPDVRAVLPWVIPPDGARGPAATATPRGDGVWRPLVALLPRPSPPARKPYEPPYGSAHQATPPAPVVAPAPPPVVLGGDAPGTNAGALSGKVVYVSAGHGFTWYDSLDRWATQRGNTNGLVEDLVNAEAVNQYLVHYLRNAGATVFTVREHDLQTHMVIVDAQSGGGSGSQGSGLYEELTGTWEDSTAAGFQTGHAPYEGSINPFAEGATRYAFASTGAPTAQARWTADVPVEGDYNVYASWAASANRVQDAHFVVHHLGGDTELRVNQQRHGGTWVFLGRFRFAPGADPAASAVSLLNDTLLGAADQVVSADAVRFGGGEGETVRGGTGTGLADGPLSNRPRWEECSRYYAQFCGAPTSVYDASSADNKDDVTTRSRLAAWHNEVGEDAVYVSWHTNAPNPGRGTSTFVYGPNPPDGSYNFTGAAGSDALAQALQAEIVGDIRASYDPSWKDRGVFSAYFGEVNPNNNPEMPAALVEVAFHDTPADADYLEEPGFRLVVARAYYQAIVKYFAARDGIVPALLPEPPRALRAQQVAGSPGSVRVTWSPPLVDDQDLGGDAAESYVVYRSADGRGFDNGVVVAGGATELVVDGLTPGVPTFFHVTARNAGGESFPTPTVAVNPTCGEWSPNLLVAGFFRMDSALLPVEDLSAWDDGLVKRLRQEEVNTYDYLVEHAWAFAAAGVPFDGAVAPAVASGALPLDPYTFVDWELGEESTADETFSSQEQAAVAAWLGLGGRAIFASGSEIGWDLEAKGSAEDTAFLHTWFGAAYAEDDAGTYAAHGGGPLASVGALSFSVEDAPPGASTYDVNYPDTFTPLAGAEVIATYDAPYAGTAAAGLYLDAPGHQAALLGFPLEAIASADARAALADSLAALFGLSRLPEAGCGGGPGPEPAVEVGPEAQPEPAAEPTAEAGPESGPELGPEPAPEVWEAPPELAAPDAAPDAAGGAEAGPLPDALGRGADPSVRLRGTSSSLVVKSETDEGCGGAPGERGGPPTVPLTLALAVAALLGARRRG